MDQRLSIITLGVDDLPRARAFYEALGWRVASEEQADSIVCFTLNGIGFALYPRARLIEDIGLEDGSRGATGAVTLAYNVRVREDVATMLDEAERAGGTHRQAGAGCLLGRPFGILQGSRQAFVGGCLEPLLTAR